jgi:hypothetical protein
VVASIDAQARRAFAHLGITAHHGCLRRCPTRADVVGGDVDNAIEHRIAGRPKVKSMPRLSQKSSTSERP